MVTATLNLFASECNCRHYMHNTLNLQIAAKKAIGEGVGIPGRRSLSAFSANAHLPKQFINTICLQVDLSCTRTITSRTVATLIDMINHRFTNAYRLQYFSAQKFVFALLKSVVCMYRNTRRLRSTMGVRSLHSLWDG